MAKHEDHLQTPTADELATAGVKARKGTDPQSRGHDPLERFLSVPNHAMFLFTSEDSVLDRYIRDHWAALDGLSGEACDIHVSLFQLTGGEDVYSELHEIRSISGLESVRPTDLPALHFWSATSTCTIPLGAFDTELKLRDLFRSVFSIIRDVGGPIAPEHSELLRDAANLTTVTFTKVANGQAIQNSSAGRDIINAYHGPDPYLFASYAHQDIEVVFQQISFLHDRGYRVWYDEGVQPGNEWPEAIALAIERSSLFLVFISPAAVASTHVRNEIHYALDSSKPLLAVHLEQTTLPPGLRLRMGSVQALMRFQMRPDSYYQKLEAALPSNCTTEIPALVDRKRQQIRDALERILVHNEAWSIGSSLLWRTERGSLISRWQREQALTPSQAQSTPGTLLPEAKEVNGVDDIANRLLEAYRSKHGPGALARLFIRQCSRPQFDPLWYSLDPDADSGDDDATCKQCGYSEIFGGTVDIPSHCPRCGLGSAEPPV